DAQATLQDVADVSGVSKVELARCYRVLVDELDLSIPVADPADCLERVALRAKVGEKVEADARQILARAAEAGATAGVYPTGLAASALYMASMLNGDRLTQKGAAEAAGVREATVRKEYRRLTKALRVDAKGSPRKKGPKSGSRVRPSSGVEVLAPSPS
ncbi:MAG: transcription initiation factor IIB family protein, partial [Nitrososphaerales archaeon]